VPFALAVWQIMCQAGTREERGRDVNRRLEDYLRSIEPEDETQA
jgi:hypothetical protein